MTPLSASVGAGGTNHPDDVARVTDRLVALGYTWAARDAPSLVRAVKLFQAIKAGRSRVDGVDGRVDPGGDTEAWLRAPNAPRWVRMTESAPGLHNHEAAQKNDHHDYGTDWFDAFIVGAAAHYQATYRNPRMVAAPITLNDVSLPEGGDTLAHKGHECGNVGDLRVPKKDGTTGTRWDAPDFDRFAARAQLKSLRATPGFKVVYFNDPALVTEGLCKPLASHDDHFHVETVPPVRQPG